MGVWLKDAGRGTQEGLPENSLTLRGDINILGMLRLALASRGSAQAALSMTRRDDVALANASTIFL